MMSDSSSSSNSNGNISSSSNNRVGTGTNMSFKMSEQAKIFNSTLTVSSPDQNAMQPQQFTCLQTCFSKKSIHQTQHSRAPCSLHSPPLSNTITPSTSI